MIKRSRDVLKMFLDEETYSCIRLGFLAVNKRVGLTCAEELEDLKQSISNGIKVDRAVIQKQYLLRAGHGGVLDSMATGVLAKYSYSDFRRLVRSVSVIRLSSGSSVLHFHSKIRIGVLNWTKAVGLCDGCKLLPHMLSSSKRYMVTGKLGQATDTYNNKGSIVSETPYDHVTRLMLEEALKEFEGEIWQTPPVYSGLKINGMRASDIVSSGGKVSLRPRPVECHLAKCVAFEPPHFTLDVSCGTGFYVRSLVHDLALAVGSCAHVTELVRTKHGPFTLKDCLHPEEYSLSSVIQAVKEARNNHPKLAERLRIYLEEQKRKEINKDNDTQNRISVEDSNSSRNRLRRSTKSFMPVKNKLPRPI